MWAFLRDRRLGGYKFRRQHSIGPYFVDFVRISEKLVVELDGGQHAEHGQTDYDEKRTHFLPSRGYRVVRYWDHEMLLDPELVLDDVLRHLQTLCPLPRPSPRFAEELCRDLGVPASWLCYVGDRGTDLATSAAAGTAGVGVRTGRGDLDRELEALGLTGRFPVTDTFREAVDLLLSSQTDRV